MRFLVDAQLPRKVAIWLQAEGCDAIHTLDLPDGNRTSDAEVIHRADLDQRVVVTKDADSVDSHILRGCPAKLLLISTGNLDNQALGALMIPLLPQRLQELQTSSFLELDGTGLTIRG